MWSLLKQKDVRLSRSTPGKGLNSRSGDELLAEVFASEPENRYRTSIGCKFLTSRSLAELLAVIFVCKEKSLSQISLRYKKREPLRAVPQMPQPEARIGLRQKHHVKSKVRLLLWTFPLSARPCSIPLPRHKTPKIERLLLLWSFLSFNGSCSVPLPHHTTTTASHSQHCRRCIS